MTSFASASSLYPVLIWNWTSYFNTALHFKHSFIYDLHSAAKIHLPTSPYLQYWIMFGRIHRTPRLLQKCFFVRSELISQTNTFLLLYNLGGDIFYHQQSYTVILWSNDNCFQFCSLYYISTILIVLLVWRYIIKCSLKILPCFWCPLLSIMSVHSSVIAIYQKIHHVYVEKHTNIITYELILGVN